MSRTLKRTLSELTAFRRLPVWLGLAALVGLLYLSMAKLGGHTGFPLDDAWIHQTYARNLAVRGEFSFVPGQPSIGSTAPLWTLLLSVGYLLGVPFSAWASGLGMAALGLSGFSMARLGRRLFPDRPWLGSVAGLALVFEWHMGWAAVSGMETMLFVWLSILLVERFAAWQRAESIGPWLAVGGIGGLLVLVRPEGIGLLGLLGLALLADTAPSGRASWRELAAGWAGMGLGAAIFIGPYLLFNRYTGGLWLPNTFYAKQQEYAIVLNQMSLARRWLTVAGTPFIGGQVLLLPGLVAALWRIVRRRDVVLGTTALWLVSHLTLYAVRLPVTYQHGRYQMPVMPWLVLLGVWGTAELLAPAGRALWRRVLGKALPVAAGAAMALFVVVGAQSYANDVEFIDTEMVKTARWLAQNTPPQAVIAAHDIGAMGYFAQRPLIDMAGLVTPAVIPIIRDETALLEFVQSAGADYLVTFPGWYPAISAALPEAYRTGSVWAIEHGYENMAVYRLKP